MANRSNSMVWIINGIEYLSTIDAAKKLKDNPQYKGLKIGNVDNFKCDKDQDE